MLDTVHWVAAVHRATVLVVNDQWSARKTSASTVTDLLAVADVPIPAIRPLR
jgi:hypothetical protein